MYGSAALYLPLLLRARQQYIVETHALPRCAHAGAMYSPGALTTPSVTSTMSLLLAGLPSLWVSFATCLAEFHM
jgi:hypothetical protein